MALQASETLEEMLMACLKVHAQEELQTKKPGASPRAFLQGWRDLNPRRQSQNLLAYQLADTPKLDPGRLHAEARPGRT